MVLRDMKNKRKIMKNARREPHTTKRKNNTHKIKKTKTQTKHAAETQVQVCYVPRYATKTEKAQRNHANIGNHEVQRGKHAHSGTPVYIRNKTYAARVRTYMLLQAKQGIGKEAATHNYQEHPCASTSASMLHAMPRHTSEKSTKITAPKNEGNQRGVAESHARPHMPGKGVKGMPKHTQPRPCTQSRVCHAAVCIHAKEDAARRCNRVTNAHPRTPHI